MIDLDLEELYYRMWLYLGEWLYHDFETPMVAEVPKIAEVSL